MVEPTGGYSASPVVGAVAGGKGIYVNSWTETGVRGRDFPAVISATQSPQWGQWFAEQYEWYTVLGCEYEIIIQNPRSQHGTDLLVGTEMDTYSDTATSTGNVMPVTTYLETLNFKGIQWTKVNCNRSETPNKHVQVISGRYKPGQAARNIVNDGDVKTWTATTAAGVFNMPNLKEQLTVNLWEHPLAFFGTVDFTRVANIQINLKYIVQFKDLRLMLRYPNTLLSSAGLTVQLQSSSVPATSDVLMEPII